MPAQLISLDKGKSYLLEKPIVLVGRSEDCDIQVDSRKVSRHHCCIAEVEGYLVIRDLDSTNGILINNVKTKEGRLKHLDELTVANLRFRVALKETASLPALPPDELKRDKPSKRVPQTITPQDEIDPDMLIPLSDSKDLE